MGRRRAKSDSKAGRAAEGGYRHACAASKAVAKLWSMAGQAPLWSQHTLPAAVCPPLVAPAGQSAGMQPLPGVSIITIGGSYAVSRGNTPVVMPSSAPNREAA